MTQKLLLFLLIFFISLTGKSQLADSCNNYTFQRLYTLPTGTPGNINDVIENADGTLVAVGEVSGSALIMKTNRKGDVIWAKKISGSAGDKFQHVKKTLDGGYLAMGITNSFGGYYLVKFASTGALAWAHSFPEPGFNNISDAIQTSDGGYAIILQSGFSPISVIAVMRLDNNANTLWTKEYKVNGFFVTSSWPGGILEENDSLVISGAVEDTLTGVFPTVEYHALSKLSKVDGSVYWAKRWLGGDLFTGMVKYNNYYYFTNYLNGQHVITKVDINGNISKVIQLTDAYSGQLPFMVQTHDNSLMIGRSLTTANIIKIGANDSLKWANKYPLSGPGLSYFNCIKEAANNQIIVGGNIGAAMSGILLSKLSADGSIGVCPVTPFTSVKTNPTLVSHPFTWTWIHSDPISNNYVGPTSTDVAFTITNICSNITDCDTLKLSGPSSACMNTDTLTFTTHRSATCFSTVQFQVDPVYGRIISSTDSTAKVVFTAAGNVKVIASISNPCGLLKDSLLVTVTNCTPSADSCTHYSFQKLYALQGSTQNNIADCVENPDGTVVFAGYKNNTTPFTTEHISALIMKVKRNGDVVWAKEIGGNWRDKFQHIKQTSDGGYIAAGVSDSYLGFIVVKFDGSGNVLWSRAIGERQGESVDILQLSDGSYAISMEGGNLSPYIEIVKLDANGNTLWYKYYTTQVNLSSASSLSGGMIEENDSLVFTGLCKDSSGPLLYFQTLTKINKYNGNVYWAKRWSGGTELTRLVKVNNYYYISHRINSQTVTTKLDLNGNIVKCSYLSDTLNSFYNIAINAIGVTHNNDLIVSRINNQLNLTRVSANGLVQWANQYPIAGPAASAFTCIKESSNNDIIAAGNTGLYNSGNTIIITRLTPDGAPSICQKTPFASNEIIIPLSSQSFTWTTFPGFFFFNSIVTPPVANVNYILTTQCSTIVGGCDSLKLSGIDSACMSTDTITYTAHRGAHCFSSVQFTVDPAGGTIINSTDSSARVVFIQPGIVKVFATITNPCGVLRDSLQVQIFGSPAPVDLGPDVTLCQNTRDTLHAGPGFRTYHWQDGSTDSVLIVTTSGQYFVSATNYCGAIFRDTVNVTFAAPQPLHIGNDTSKCNTDTLTLTATGGFASYTWSPNYTISSTGSQTVKVWPSIDTSYKLTATTALRCTSKDSIRISVFHSTPINLGNDTSFCKGGSIVLNAGPGFTNYLWNTGATNQLLIADSARPYIITAINVHQCISRDTLNILTIFPNPVVDLRKDSSLCSGSSITLDAGPGYTNYLWQDGSTARTFSISNIGIYSVTVTDGHQCKGSDTTSMKQILPLPANFIYPDTAICEVQTISLQPSGSFASYLWSTGSTANRINITSAGSYWLQVTNTSGCMAKEYISVAPKNCIKAVYFPNAFTPNMDGLNDVFHATVYGSLVSFHLVIYNRFGQKVFETTDQSKGWDGKLKGQDVGIGTFVWFCGYQFINATAQTQKGSVTLLK